MDRRGSSRFRIEASDDSSDNEMPEPEQVPLRPGEVSKVIELTKAEQCLLFNTRFANFLKTQAKCKTGRQANLLRLTGESQHIEKYIKILKDSAGGNYRVADEPSKMPDQIGTDEVMRMTKVAKVANDYSHRDKSYPYDYSSSAINSVLNYKIPAEIENQIKEEDFSFRIGRSSGQINPTEKINRRIEEFRKRSEIIPEAIIDLTDENSPPKRQKKSRFSDNIPSVPEINYNNFPDVLDDGRTKQISKNNEIYYMKPAREGQWNFCDGRRKNPEVPVMQNLLAPVELCFALMARPGEKDPIKEIQAAFENQVEIRQIDRDDGKKMFIFTGEKSLVEGGIKKLRQTLEIGNNLIGSPSIEISEPVNMGKRQLAERNNFCERKYNVNDLERSFYLENSGQNMSIIKSYFSDMIQYGLKFRLAKKENQEREKNEMSEIYGMSSDQAGEGWMKRKKTRFQNLYPRSADYEWVIYGPTIYVQWFFKFIFVLHRFYIFDLSSQKLLYNKPKVTEVVKELYYKCVDMKEHHLPVSENVFNIVDKYLSLTREKLNISIDLIFPHAGSNNQYQLYVKGAILYIQCAAKLVNLIESFISSQSCDDYGFETVLPNKDDFDKLLLDCRIKRNIPEPPELEKDITITIEIERDSEEAVRCIGYSGLFIREMANKLQVFIGTQKDNENKVCSFLVKGKPLAVYQTHLCFQRLRTVSHKKFHNDRYSMPNEERKLWIHKLIENASFNLNKVKKSTMEIQTQLLINRTSIHRWLGVNVRSKRGAESNFYETNAVGTERQLRCYEKVIEILSATPDVFKLLDSEFIQILDLCKSNSKEPIPGFIHDGAIIPKEQINLDEGKLLDGHWKSLKIK